MVLELALLLVAAALPGLVWRRTASRTGRCLALVAMAGVIVAALDLPRELLHRIPPRVTVVPTGDPGDGAALRELLGAEVDVEAGGSPVGERLARARLRTRHEPDLATVFTGRLPVAPRRGGARSPFVALSRRGVAPVDPAAVVVRVATALERGRPGVLEVELGPEAALVEGLTGQLRVRDPAGALVVDEALSGRSTRRIDWRPKDPGPHRVELDLAHGAGDERIEWRGRGEVVVAAPDLVTVVGRAAADLVAALSVQEFAVQAAPVLPAEPVGTLVLLDPLSVAEQQRVAEFVEAGGGVFLVGDAGGGAVPVRGSSLAAIAPIVRLPVPPKDDKGGTGGPGEARVDPPPVRPDPPPKTPDQTPPDPKATGDTRGARTKIEEREVERRRIAMVIVVDRSGSMLDFVPSRDGGPRRTKMDLAKASALHTAVALDAGDELAVVSFGSGSTVVLPLSPVQDRASIRKHLESLRARAGETTHVRTGLDDARRLLADSKAAVKHVVVVTDGEIHDTGPVYFSALPAADRFVEEKTGITLSVVLASPQSELPAGAATRARHLVVRGNGVADKDTHRFFFQVDSFDHVPRLLSTEVESLRTKAGRPGKRDDTPGPPRDTPPPDKPAPKRPDPPPDKPPGKQDPPRDRLLAVHALAESELLAPALEPGAAFPGVAGVLPVEARADAQTLLAVEDGSPLLAFANRGLGRIGAWSADLTGPWGAAWAADPAYPGRLAQWIRFLSPPRPATDNTAAVRDPEVLPSSVPLPRDAEALRRLGGSGLQAAGDYIPPDARVETEVVGQAPDHALAGLVLLVLLAVVEFVTWRRPTLSPRSS